MKPGFREVGERNESSEALLVAEYNKLKKKFYELASNLNETLLSLTNAPSIELCNFAYMRYVKVSAEQKQIVCKLQVIKTKLINLRYDKYAEREVGEY